MNIFIARHGQDKDNENQLLNGHRDEELTELGKDQAAKAGKSLLNDGVTIDIVLSSPLKRAYDTAKIISKTIGGPEPIIEELLIERDFGILTGKPLADIPKYATKTLQTDVVNYFIEAKDAEDFPSLYKRTKKLLNKIESQYKDKNILLVTHGDTGKMLRAVYHGWDWKKGLMTPYFKNSEILKLETNQDTVE